jgi:hypothetical protein
MYFTREAQTAPEEIEATPKGGPVSTAVAEQANEYDSGVLSHVFSGSPGEPPRNATKTLLRSPSLSSRSNTGIRVIALSRAQRTQGNRYTQRLVSQIQLNSKPSRMVQRQCACGATCEKCSSPALQSAMPVIPEELSIVQRQASGSMPRNSRNGSNGREVIPSNHGQPLDELTRDLMEERIGADFADVRVHTDERAAASAEALNANAYTTGRDIYFGAGKYAPDTQDGQRLLAHELTHTVQQAGGATPVATSRIGGVAIGDASDPLESEADQVADAVASGRPTGHQISTDLARPVRRGIRSRAADLWGATGGQAVEYIGEKVENAVEGTKEWFIEKIETYAPGLLKLIQGGAFDYLKEQITAGLDGIFGGVISRIQKDGFFGTAKAIISELTGSLTTAASGLLAGACDTFAKAAEAVTGFVKSIAGTAFEGIKKAAKAVGEFFSNLWKDIGAPVWEAIKSVAGAAWKWIEDTAKWIWEKTAPIRTRIATAWNWIKEQFGLAWDSGSSVFDWLKEKAKGAWDAVYEFTKPIHGPLKVLGIGLLIVSGIGPIIAIWKGAPLLWDALTWLYNQWKKTDFIVIARNALTEHILPAIASGAQAAAGLLETAANWISEKVDSINNALGGLLDVLGVSALFTLAKKAVQFVADAFRAFANWVKNDFLKTLNKIKDVLLKIWNFIKPILAFLLKLVIVAANPLLLPIVLTGYLWRALPSCFKPPIIDFILDLLIAVVRALPNFKMFGESWPPTKAKILEALMEVRNYDVDKKIEASNRVARIMSGDDLEWLGNIFAAMIMVPDYIEGQFEEELIGMNLTEPLPFERSTPPDAASSLSQGVAAGTMSAEDAALLTNPNLTEGQIGVDQVANLELDRELVEDLQAHGGDREFRGPEDPSRTIAGIQAEFADPSQGPAAADAQGGTTTAAEGTQSPDGTPQVAPVALSTDDQLEMFMNQPPPNTCTQERAPQPEGGSSIPEALKIGPLTRGQRARYLLHQIGQGIKTWFNCNSSWLVPTIIGVIAVLVAVEILTGGAITAALPAILEVITAIMIGVAAVRVAMYAAEYVAKAISGDVAGAAKSLARGLAVAGIELIFALLFNIDKVIKSLKQGLKATAEAAAKSAKAAVKGTVESVQELGRIGVKGLKTAGRNIAGAGKAIVKNGKLLLEGIGQGFAKGIRKVEELFQRLWKKLRFKGFRIRLSGAWFRLEGEINPWVLIAEGKITWIDEAAVIEGKGAKLGEKVVGKTAAGETIEGLFVGSSKQKPNYRKIADLFFEEELSKANVIHHAIEQQVQKRFPGLFALEEIHGGSNLRAILKGAFNSEVHLSKIRILWNDFYQVIEAAGLSGDSARKAFGNFRAYVDGYIEAMTKFMSSNEAVLKAVQAGDNEAVRALLQAESARLLTGAKKAAQDSVATATTVAAGA